MTLNVTFINRRFAVGAALLLVAVVLLQGVLSLTPLGMFSKLMLWSFAVMAMLLWHKLAVADTWLQPSVRFKNARVLKLGTIYLMPLGVLWAFFVREFFQVYLPQAGLSPSPYLLIGVGYFGISGLIVLILGEEMRRLKGPGVGPQPR